MRLTFLSDTHNKHKSIPKESLLGGDIIFHSGDLSSRGYVHEVENFLAWYSKLDYKYKVFIAGNHDFLFQDDPKKCQEILSRYPDVIYLQDSFVEIEGLKIWGSPWQPEFYNWAFNLPRNGPELLEKWRMVPGDCDILLTHGPPFGILDVLSDGKRVGCEVLYEEVTKFINPKIHSFGHIHCGYGYKNIDGTVYLNSSSLDEDYMYSNSPINLTFDKENNLITFN